MKTKITLQIETSATLEYSCRITRTTVEARIVSGDAMIAHIEARRRDTGCLSNADCKYLQKLRDGVNNDRVLLRDLGIAHQIMLDAVRDAK